MATEYVKNIRAEYGDVLIYINNEPWSSQVEIYAMVQRAGRRYIVNQGKNDLVMTEEIEGATKAKPLIKLPKDIYYAFALVFKDVIPPVEKQAIDGELKATKYHLEDLRKLLKIK